MGNVSPDRDEILREIANWVDERGGVPTEREFRNAHGWAASVFSGSIWKRWGDAVRDAGYEPRAAMKPALTTETVMQALALLTRDLGSYPTFRDVEHASRTSGDVPSMNTVRRHLGRKQVDQIRFLSDWLATHEGFEDVRAILAKRSQVANSVIEADDHATDGYVYMLKSGSNYKIGMTRSVGRRWAEIAAAMPDDVELIHYLSTDDAVGIEAYWHRRFKAVRQGGEWFRLAAVDVAAFKRRRKFM